MNVNIRQLEGFVQVARLGGFSLAASRLHLTQAGLSILIRKLEESLDTRLFERTTRNVVLTAAGREILPAAERILADARSISTTAREIGAHRIAHITLALPPLLAATRLPNVLARFHAEHPQVAVSFRECINEELINRVYTRDVDFGLAFGIEPNSALECEVLGEDALVAVCAATHPLARKRTLRWRDLVGLPIITLPATSAGRMLIEQQFAALGATLAPVYEANSLVAIALARVGLGVAIVSADITRPALGQDLVQHVLREPTVTRKLLVVTRRISTLSASSRAFIDLFAQAALKPAARAGSRARASGSSGSAGGSQR
jgi:LysR family carnitine catabolism transcriptional activator